MGAGSTPTAPPIPVSPPAAAPATLGSSLSQTSASSANARNKAAAGIMGYNSTIGTSAQGLTQQATTAPAQLLGQ